MRAIKWGFLLVLSGCGAIFGPDEHREVGVILGLAAGEPAIDLPAQAAAGEEISVVITTTWRDGCARRGFVDLRESGSEVVLTPYDLVSEGICTQAVQEFEHTVTLQFDEPGTRRVIVRGRPTDDAALVSTEREIEISP
jgi:hypothetical protein